MKAKQLREMSRDDLNGTLTDLEKRLFELRSQAVTEKLENPHQLGLTRKDIARVLTVLRERGETGIEERQYHLESAARHQKTG